MNKNKKNKNKRVSKNKNKKIVAVSGGFDPIHVRHAEMIEQASVLGDKLVVIVNNDNWLKKKKGYAFMPESERVKILKSIKGVDEVFLTEHEPDTNDMSICHALRKVRPHIFGKGGDRFIGNIPEVAVCEEINCQIVDGLGDKIQSSSWLLKDYFEKIKKKK